MKKPETKSGGSLKPVGSAVKRSDIYLACWMAAEDALPEEAKQLIKSHDALHAAWREAGWPRPIPQELLAAAKRIEADPLANIAFELRQKTDTAASEEWREANPPNKD